LLSTLVRQATSGRRERQRYDCRWRARVAIATSTLSLLAFHPQFQMTDLPTTSWSQAEAALRAAHEAGLHQKR
jgi:pyruvate-formate lyase-activating enzyme